GDGLVVGGLNGIVTGVQAKGNGGGGIIANGTGTTNTADGDGGGGGLAPRRVGHKKAGGPNTFLSLTLLLRGGAPATDPNNNNGGNGKPQVFGGIQMGPNVCGGDTICP